MNDRPGSHPDAGHAATQSPPIVREFAADGPVGVEVRNLRGEVTLRAEHGTTARVELTAHGAAARDLAERTTIDFSRGRLTVDVPAGEFEDVSASFGLGDVFRSVTGSRADRTDGRSVPLSDRIAAGVRSLVRSAEGMAGELTIEVIVPSGSRAALTTGIGGIDVRGVLADLEVRTGTGDVSIADGGRERTRATTGTGDITCGPVAGSSSLTTGTGDVTVADARGGSLGVRTGLGDVEIRVAHGTAARLDLATGLGDRDVQLTPTGTAVAAERTLEVEARCGTGDLRVMRARQR